MSLPALSSTILRNKRVNSPDLMFLKDVPLISDVLRQNSKFHVQLTSVGEGREEADEHPT